MQSRVRQTCNWPGSLVIRLEGVARLGGLLSALTLVAKDTGSGAGHVGPVWTGSAS